LFLGLIFFSGPKYRRLIFQQLLAAGITMKQIAAMEVTHTGHVLEQQEWAVQTG